jgi:hypothetical protein
LVLLKLNEKAIMESSYEEIMLAMFDILKSPYFCSWDKILADTRRQKMFTLNLSSSRSESNLPTETNEGSLSQSAIMVTDRQTDGSLTRPEEILGVSTTEQDYRVSKYKDFNVKPMSRQEKVNEPLLHSLQAEYVQVAKKIEQFWDSYGKLNNKMKTHMSKFNLDA